jgi:hypothetical protein
MRANVFFFSFFWTVICLVYCVKNDLRSSATVEKRFRAKILLSWHAGDEIFFRTRRCLYWSNKRCAKWYSVVIITVRHPTRKIDRSTIPQCVRGYGVELNFQKRTYTTSFYQPRGQYYKTKVLEWILLRKAQKLHADEYYCFQQDGAPSHTATIVQRWCEYNLTDFIPKDEWPSSSPDLNILDFSIWGYMLGQLRNYKYATLLEFKKFIQRIYQIQYTETCGTCRVWCFWWALLPREQSQRAIYWIVWFNSDLKYVY